MTPTVDVLTTDFNADYCRIQQLTTGDFAVFDNENAQYVATCPDYLTLVNWLKKPIPPLSESVQSTNISKVVNKSINQ